MLVYKGNTAWWSQKLRRNMSKPLQWRHNDHDGVSNHQHHGCLLNRLFGHRSKKTSRLRVTGLCAGNSPDTGEFPAQMASNAENASIWWRHHGRNMSKPACNTIRHQCMLGHLQLQWWSNSCHVSMHYSDVIISATASRITGVSIDYWTVYSDQRKLHSSASMAFVMGIHRWPLIPHTKGQ